MFYCGKSTVYHVGAGTLAYESPRKTYLNFRNGLSLIFKHFNAWEMVLKLPLRMTLDWVAAGLFLIKGQWKNSQAIAKAQFDFLRHLKRDAGKRKEIQNYGPYSKTCIRRGLIVYDYYIRRRKRVQT